ncbi:MAG: aldolase/citrate lyase family protein [Candidatus Firestonebacteria bacterium]
MNNLERKMVDVLKDLKENNGVTGIKAEFEAEGTRMEEALRLKDVITKAGLGLSLKIGGCEAIKDMYEARTIGVERIIAPMVESPFSLIKFLRATKLAYPKDEQEDIDFLVNIETITAYNNFEKMLEIPEIQQLDGIVIGRVDMTGSMGLSREDINNDKIFDIVKDLVVKAKNNNKKKLDTVVGGGVSAFSIPFFKRLPENTLDRYETRKVIFECIKAFKGDPDKGILKAVGFELLWLKNKRGYYSLIESEDAQRIVMLESRYKKMIEDAGGKYE